MEAKNTLKDLKIVCGRNSRSFAKKVEKELKKKFGLEDFSISPVEVEKFEDGEIKPKIQENMRKKDVYVIQSFHKKPHGINEDIWELFLLNDAVIRSSARSVTNVLPYIPYSRQEKKVEGRVPISVKVLISFLEFQKIERIVTMDLHSPAIQAFANIPIDNLESRALFLPLLQKNCNKDVILVSPDLGDATRVEKYAKYLDLNFTTIRKKRALHNRNIVEVNEIEGAQHLEEKEVIIVDDIVDTGGTIEKSYKLLKEKGVDKVKVYCCHSILSGSAVERLSQNGLKLIGTDTIPHTAEFLERNKRWFKTESVAPYFAEAIYRIQTGSSVSQDKLLFP